MNKHTKIIIGIACALMLIAAVVYITEKRGVSPAETPDGQKSDAPFTIEGIEGLPEGATATITDRVNAERFNSTPRPSLTRALPEGALPSDAYALLAGNRKTLVAALTENPAAMSNWISLGTIHKQVGDYEGALLYWTYVKTVNPENLVIHWNLATLYELYLKDSAAAEKEFAAVIALDKTYVSAYVELAVMYAGAGKRDQALAVLASGIKENAGAIDLYIARAHLYRDMGKTGESRNDYNAAIALATKANNTQLVTVLTQERDAL